MTEPETATNPEKTTNQNHDSTTLVHPRLHGNRTTMTVRILPEIKEAFTRRTRQMGLSTCHVTEGLLYGWLRGVDEQINLVHQSPTINLTLVRDVKRVRRYTPEFVETVSAQEEIENREVVVKGCAVCGKKGYAVVTRKDKSRACLCRDHFEVEKKQIIGWRVLEAPFE